MICVRGAWKGATEFLLSITLISYRYRTLLHTLALAEISCQVLSMLSMLSSLLRLLYPRLPHIANLWPPCRERRWGRASHRSSDGVGVAATCIIGRRVILVREQGHRRNPPSRAAVWFTLL